MLKRLLVFCFILFLTTTITACGGEKPAVVETDAQEAEAVFYLFVQTAQSAALTRVSGNEYTITLNGIPPVVTRFSDRPAREADVIEAEWFFASWDGLFKDDPPNAALVFSEPNREGQDTAVLELSEANYDQEAGTVTYRAIDIEADDMALAELPDATGACSLFIDDVDGGWRPSDAELKAILDAHALWLSSGGAQGKQADLTNADLYSASLSGANLSRAVLSGATMYQVNLGGADLSGAAMTGGDLYHAHLAGASLIGADLTNANLTSADLTNANLSDAILTGANLSGAITDGVIWRTTITYYMYPRNSDVDMDKSQYSTDYDCTSEILLMAFDHEAANYRSCDGSSLNIDEKQYQDAPVDYLPIYSFIGLTYGGASEKNFKLPDLSAGCMDSSGNPLTLRYQICVKGESPLNTGAASFVKGDIKYFAHGGVPSVGYLGEIKPIKGLDEEANPYLLPCDGRSMLISQNQALFSLLGTEYGGDGIYRFNLPDMSKVEPPVKGTKYYMVTSGIYPPRW